MGPLTGVRVLELGGVGPVPFCGMILSDYGADVIRVQRPQNDDRERGATGYDTLTDGILSRGRRFVTIDLKQPEGLEAALALVERSDVLLEGFRPGVAERLGIGPRECHLRNPGLVYGRVTGWGQEGPLALVAGHDLDYLAIAGVLTNIGYRDRPPVPPLNLIADFGGGGMLLANGVLAALLHARTTGEGQVIDAAMVDGAAYQMTMAYEMLARGNWFEERELNANDGGAPFYSVYETSDDKYIAVAAMEPKFYRTLLDQIGLVDVNSQEQWDRTCWPTHKAQIAQAFGLRARDEWMELLEGQDVCVAPVLAMSEVFRHPHHLARRTFIDVGGQLQPAPAPRFDRTSTGVDVVPGRDDTDGILREIGFDDARIEALREAGVVER